MSSLRDCEVCWKNQRVGVYANLCAPLSRGVCAECLFNCAEHPKTVELSYQMNGLTINSNGLVSKCHVYDDGEYVPIYDWLDAHQSRIDALPVDDYLKFIRKKRKESGAYVPARWNVE